MSRQLTRQWQLLGLLTRRWWTVADLARELGASKPTIDRDLRVLAAVMPVQNRPAPGPAGRDQEQRRLWTVVPRDLLRALAVAPEVGRVGE